MRNTDADWELFARRDPYWAVITADRFRREKLTESGLKDFFQSGEGTVEGAVQVLDRHFHCPERFGVALDFGCGVGRLLLPLARRARMAVGVDVSPTMLEECRKNAAAVGTDNIALHRSDDSLSDLQKYAGQVDFLSSLLVFQHIPPHRGFLILGNILKLLAPTCYGVLQFVSGHQPASPGAGREPVMEMNPYDIDTVFAILRENGIQQMFCWLDEHDRFTGVTTFFHRRS